MKKYKFSRNYKKVLSRILKRKDIMSKKEKQEQSVVPNCLAALNDILSRVEKAKSGCFVGAPDYFKQELDNVKSTLLSMFKNLSLRMGGVIPDISASKIIACADSLAGVDESTRKELLDIAAIKSGVAVSLSPELIKNNANSFRVLYDESNIEANEDAINVHAKAEFQITVDGKVKTCTLDCIFPVPEANLILTQKV